MRTVMLACVLSLVSPYVSAHTVRVGTLTLLMCDGVNVRKSLTEPGVLEFTCPTLKEPVFKLRGCTNSRAFRDNLGNLTVTCGVTK